MEKLFCMKKQRNNFQKTIKSLSLCSFYPGNILYPQYQIQIGRILRRNMALCKLFCFLMRKFNSGCRGGHFEIKMQENKIFEHFFSTLVRAEEGARSLKDITNFLMDFFIVSPLHWTYVWRKVGFVEMKKV